MDYTSITAAVDWADALTALAGVGVAVAGVLVAIRGARILLGFIRR